MTPYAKDFTSTCYLGIWHPASALNPWSRFSLGKAAGLQEHPLSQKLAFRLAKLQRMEAGLLYPSSLHLFWEVFDFLQQQKSGIAIADDAYPVARWAIRGQQPHQFIRSFQADKLKSLQQLVHHFARNGRKPVVVTDGWSLQRRQVAPLAEYLSILQPYGGWLVIDDTQSLGIWGYRPDAEHPYGRGGGGTIPYLGLKSGSIICGSSTAKGLGVPVAVLSGAHEVIQAIKATSKIRWHCSPPSIASLSALDHALKVNEERGEILRRMLWKRVRHALIHMQQPGTNTEWNIFPLQGIRITHTPLRKRLYHQLQIHGFRTLYSKKEIGLLFRADIHTETINTLMSIIGRTLGIGPNKKHYARFYR